MQKKIPNFDRIKIGFFTWTIKFIYAHATENAGMSCKENKEMLIYLSGNQEIDRDTVWHEIKHAIIDDATDLLFKHEDRKPDDMEEELIKFLVPKELAVLRDNPELAKWILK